MNKIERILILFNPDRTIYPIFINKNISQQPLCYNQMKVAQNTKQNGYHINF